MNTRLPLTVGQLGVWYSQQLDQKAESNCIGQYVEITGPVDSDLFERAVRIAAGECQCLQVRFVADDRGIWQELGALPDDWEFPILQLDNTPDARRIALDWMTSQLDRIIDLGHGPTFSMALLKLPEERSLWFQCSHHIVMDGFGGSLLVHRVAEVYTELVSDGHVKSPALGSLQALVEDELIYRGSEKFAEDRRYWLDQFTDRPEPVVLSQRFSGVARALRETDFLPAPSVSALVEAARGSRSAWHAAIMGAVAVYVHRMTGESDIVLNLAVTARSGPVARSTPGMVSNLLPVRIKVSPMLTFGELISQVSATMREGLRHQRYRHEDLRKDLGDGPGRDNFSRLHVNIMPLDPGISFAGLQSVAHDISNGMVDDLSIAVYGRAADGCMRFDFDGNSVLYGPDELAGHQDRFLRLVESLVADPEQRLGAVEVLTSADRELLARWNGTERAVAAGSLPGLFEAQAARSPEAVAVVCGEVSLSYREVNERANRLARLLAGRGAGTESVVAVAVDKSAELVVALLGIVKAGAAYLPVDPGYPAERVGFMLADAGPAVVVTTAGLAGLAGGAGGVPVVVLDDPGTAAELAGLAGGDLGAGERGGPLLGGHPAYVMYTSGSTGRPKGVIVTHAGVVNLVQCLSERLNADRLSSVLQLTPVSFDMSVAEIFMSISCGSSLVMPTGIGSHGELLGAFIKETAISHCAMTPSILGTMDPEDFPDLEALVVGGEPCSPEVAGAWSAGRRMVNGYGPTETTVCVAMSDPLHGAGPVPIGRPVWNTRVFVLDEWLGVVPAGVAGELYVAGVQL
ncbi:MAG: AMP-binding protein, partial [Streptosporangiaceae bacterium]